MSPIRLAKNRLPAGLAISALALLASCEAVDSFIAWRNAHMHTYQVTVRLQSGSFAGQTYTGTFVVDQFDVQASGVQTIEAAAMHDFRLDMFGSQFGPVEGAGTAQFVDGCLVSIGVVVSVPSASEGGQKRNVGFSVGFTPDQVPPGLGNRWFGYLDAGTHVDGFGVYELADVTPPPATGQQ